ncbi:hypothetical protein ACNJYG_08700 [Pseudomonas sp. GW6]
MQYAIPIQNHKITPADLPGAPLSLLTEISAGRGWLSLVREALAVLPAGAEVLQIKEKFGALRVITNARSPDVRKALQPIEYKSLEVCEICGAEGILWHDGEPGKPAGWLRTRCDEHAHKRVQEVSGTLSEIQSLAERMRDHQIKNLEAQLAELRNSPGNDLAGPFILTMTIANLAVPIRAAFAVPSDVIGQPCDANTSWHLALFTPWQPTENVLLDLHNALFDDAPASVRDRVELFCYDNSAMLARCRTAGIQLTLHG